MGSEVACFWPASIGRSEKERCVRNCRTGRLSRRVRVERMRVNLEKLKKRDDGAATQRHRPRSLRGILLASSDAHPVLEIRDIFRRASLVSVSVSQDTRVSCILFHGTSA